MAELHYKDGGTWRKAKELHYRDGGTWRKLKEAWYRDGGAWRKVFSDGGVISPLAGATINRTVFYEGEAVSITALIIFNANGTVDWTDDDGASTRQWFDPTTANVGASFWVRATVTAGSVSGGSGVGTWLQLNAQRFWTRQRATIGASSATLSIQIATDSAGTNIVTSGTYTLVATVEV